MSSVDQVRSHQVHKNFAVVSSSNLSVEVHPAVILTILDAFVRRPEGAVRRIGTLLGYVSDRNVVMVTDCFSVVHEDNEVKGVLMNLDYHKQMVKLRQKVTSKEQIVGWWCTCSEVQDSSVVIHNFYLQQSMSGFQATPVLQSPIHMIVDTALTNDKLSIKAYMSKDTVCADSLVQFHEIPLRVDCPQAEKSGIAMLLQSRNKEVAKPTNKHISNMDAFHNTLSQLLELAEQTKKYTQAVINGEIKGDASIGRELTRVLCSEPFFSVSAFEELCTNSLQDTLMVVYLSNLTRTQITLAEKINSAYSNAK